MTRPKDDGLVSTDFASSRFSPHGVMEMRDRDGILWCELTGPMNLEFVQAYLKMWRHAVQARPPSETVLVLVRWQQTLLITPDATEHIRAVLARSGRKVPCHIVWVVPEDIEGRSLLLDTWVSMYEDAGIPLEVFSDDEAAQARVLALQRALRGQPEDAAGDRDR